MSGAAFERLIEEAARIKFTGWHFGFLDGRYDEQPPPWDYRQRLQTLLPDAHALLDLDTGGGEFLASLDPLPAIAVATENHAPNVPIARARLEPLGVSLLEAPADAALPFDDATFDLVSDRHGAFLPTELFRLLRTGGRFVTQQVGDRNLLQLNQHLGCPAGESPEWNLAMIEAGLAEAGFILVDALEAFPPARFTDVGAIVAYLGAVPWQVPGFEVERYREPLRALHDRIAADGDLHVHTHRIFVEAIRD